MHHKHGHSNPTASDRRHRGANCHKQSHNILSRRGDNEWNIPVVTPTVTWPSGRCTAIVTTNVTLWRQIGRRMWQCDTSRESDVPCREVTFWVEKWNTMWRWDSSMALFDRNSAVSVRVDVKLEMLQAEMHRVLTLSGGAALSPGQRRSVSAGLWHCGKWCPGPWNGCIPGWLSVGPGDSSHWSANRPTAAGRWQPPGAK